MRTLMFTIISLLGLTNISLAQLDCLEGFTTVSIDPWTNTAVLFPRDFLVDAQAEGNFELSIDGVDFFESIELEEGEFQITILNIVSGETCEASLLVNDQITPVPICRDLVQIVITGSIATLRVEDLDFGSHDSGNSEVTLGLSINGIDERDPLAPGFIAETELQFGPEDVCQEIGVLLNVWDAAGNGNACFTTVQINNDLGDCDFSNATQAMREEVAADEIPLFVNPLVQNLERSVFDFEINGVQPTPYANGTYGLPMNVIQQTDNVLTIIADDVLVLDGVSTLDLVMLIRFLVEGNPLTIEQIISADLDKSGDLSITRDAILFTNLILGLETEIQGDDFFIIPEGVESINSLDAFNFENDFSSFSFDRSEIDEVSGITIGVHKFGDLNGNFTESRSSEPGLLSFDNSLVESNEEIFIEFSLSSENVNSFIGAQAELLFQSGAITSVDNNDYSGLNFIFDEQSLRFSFADNDDHSELTFTVGFIPNEKVYLEDILRLSNSFNTEFITSELNLGAIELQANVTTSLDTEEIESIVQIYPNPVSEIFTITVNEKQIGKELSIINQLGQIELVTDIKNLHTKVDISTMSSGLKFIRLEDDIEIHKLMVN